MDLTQNKLTRTEWDSIEVPVSDSEKDILKMIMDGFTYPDIVKNKTMSLFSFTKIEYSKENEQFLYDKYFAPTIQDIVRKYGIIQLDNAVCGNIKKMKSIDILRIQNLESNIETNKKLVYEFVALDFCSNLCKYLSKNKAKYAFY